MQWERFGVPHLEKTGKYRWRKLQCGQLDQCWSESRTLFPGFVVIKNSRVRGTFYYALSELRDDSEITNLRILGSAQSRISD